MLVDESVENLGYTKVWSSKSFGSDETEAQGVKKSSQWIISHGLIVHLLHLVYGKPTASPPET